MLSTDATANYGENTAGDRSIDARRKSAERAWFLTGGLFAIFAALFFLVGSAGSLYWHHLSVLPVPAPQPPNERTTHNGKSTTDASQVSRDLNRVAFDLEALLAKRALAVCSAAESNWEELRDTTLYGETGRTIANDEKLLLRFILLDQITSHDLQEALPASPEERLAALRSRATATSDGRTLGELTAAVAALRSKAQTATNFHQARLVLLNDLRVSSAALPAAAMPLHRAIQQRQEQIKQNRLRATNAARAAVTKEVNSELERLQSAHTHNNTRLEALQEQLAAIQSGRQVPQTTPALPPSQASRDSFREKRKVIATLLKPFTSPGYAQPTLPSGMSGGREKIPMSLSKLQQIGALDKDRGIRLLYRIGGLQSGAERNDRPLGSFPRMNSLAELEKPDVKQRVELAQRLLREFGLLLVEDGLLSP